MKKIRWRSLAADLACDVAGSILFAMGIVTFASKAEFAPGGISGLALLVNHFVPIPIGIGTLFSVTSPGIPQEEIFQQQEEAYQAFLHHCLGGTQP